MTYFSYYLTDFLLREHSGGVRADFSGPPLPIPTNPNPAITSRGSNFTWTVNFVTDPV